MTTPTKIGMIFATAAWVSLAACNETFPRGDYMDQPFGRATAKIGSMSNDDVTVILSEVYQRYSSYLHLRGHIAFESILGSTCAQPRGVNNNTIRGQSTADCAVGEDATGRISFEQSSWENPPEVIVTTTLTYESVKAPGIEVTGTETLRETQAPHGASVRTLDVTQNEIAFTYVFRVGILDDGKTAIDYRLETPAHAQVLVRLTSPEKSSEAATATLIGTDGNLQCTIQNIPWEKGKPARGSCEGRGAFGLPSWWKRSPRQSPQ